jgi:hypothetical protein
MKKWNYVLKNFIEFIIFLILFGFVAVTFSALYVKYLK